MDTKALLRSIKYLSAISDPQLAALIDRSRVLDLDCGATLVQQGEVGQYAYLLLDGRLRSSRVNRTGTETILGEISRGEVVGETAALLEMERTATVTALRDSILLRIDRDELLELIYQNKEALLQFTRTMVERSQSRTSRKSAVRSILVLPISPAVDADEFARQLCQALNPYGNTQTLTRARLTERSGWNIPPANQPNEVVPLRARLALQENDHRFTVYTAEPEFDTWLQAVAGRADRIILVGAAEEFRPPSNFERQLYAGLAQINEVKIELALLHPSAERAPSGTRQWFAERDIYRHHHLVRQAPEDMARLARFLSNRAVGIALSGGGFKAAIQGGILHALAEGGIPMDLLGGSSGGAYAAAMFANRPSLDRMADLVAERLLQFRKVARLTFPIVSIYSGKGITQAIQEAFGTQDLEDLWNLCFCTSLSLVTGKINIHQRGPAWEAVRASTSVMGIFPRSSRTTMPWSTAPSSIPAPPTSFRKSGREKSWS
ncbi:MAG: cyclic nucleotide-binding and patatin-like phospholipase domain-containing protein [Bacteroidota bacterium]